MDIDIKVNKKGQWRVTGELSFTTVPKLYKTGYDLITKHENLIFDLQDIIALDNSGLALLTAWARLAKKLDKAICFVNLPNKLLDIAKLSGLEDILPIR
jgi:phospholipid transport system transporter-binding protein